MFGDNRATPRLKRPRPINASFPSSPGDSQKNSLRVCWRVLHPRGICVGNWRRVRRARSLPYGGRVTPVFTLKLLPGRLPASLRRWFDPMRLQNRCNGAAANTVSEIGQRALDAPVTPIPVLLGISNHQRLDLAGDGRSPRRGRIFLAISFRCQANSLSGVTMVATSARSFRPNPLDLAANRRTWSSFNRSRRH